MNLEDVIDPEYGLQQDEWSLSKPTFGKENQLEVIGIWEFPSVASCKQAEQYCLSSVSERGIISKSDYPDGWTETVPVSALSEVITTYNFFGGIKLNI